MVSAINLIPLIIIMNPIRPALVVPKLVNIVQNLGSWISSEPSNFEESSWVHEIFFFLCQRTKFERQLSILWFAVSMTASTAEIGKQFILGVFVEDIFFT